MATVPTGRMERELRKLYLRWVRNVPREMDNIKGYIEVFERQSAEIIKKFGGRAASMGAILGFPAPKVLPLSPVANVIYDEMKQAAVQASLASGMSSKEVARAMLNAGLDKSYRRLERFARTETTNAYWKNQWKSTDGLDLVMLWSVEESDRTCDLCISKDGLVVEDEEIRDHPNGRCTLIPTRREAVDYIGTLTADGGVAYDDKWDNPRPTEQVEEVKPIV